MKFTKMHGCANDYVYINCLDGLPQDIPALAVRLSDRHTGVGGDGIVLICRSDIADFKMRMFNVDGSEGKMCGNAVRCVGKYVFDRGFTDKCELDIETLSGIKHLSLRIAGGKAVSVTVSMGAPVIKTVDGVLSVFGKMYRYCDISMGNPHCVIFTDGVDTMRIEEIGREIENMTSVFPQRTNVEFVQVMDKNTVRMRVWERGSGETMACGTGACASAVAAIEKQLCDINCCVTVLLNGGSLEIEYKPDKSDVLMTGPAEFVIDGEIAL